MSKGGKAAVALAAVAAVGATSPPAVELLEGTPPPDADGNAMAEFVESEVVAENRRLRAEVERLTAELAEAHADTRRRLDEQNDRFNQAWAEREQQLASNRSGLDLERPPLGTIAELVHGHRARRAVFDASVPGVDARGERVTFAPGDPVPPHINPATLPEGAVRYEDDR